MTLITALGSEFLMDPEMLSLSCSTNVLAELVFRELSLTAVMKLLVRYSKTFDSRFNLFMQDARIADVARDPALCGIVQGAIRSHCRRYARAKKLVRRFLEAFQLVKKI